MNPIMKRKILILLAIFFLAVSCGVIYLNKVILPVKIKSLIIKALEEATGKRVAIGSMRFNIFKGILIKDFSIYDEGREIIGSKEVSCTVLVFPILKEYSNLRVHLESPRIMVERAPTALLT